MCVLEASLTSASAELSHFGLSDAVCLHSRLEQPVPASLPLTYFSGPKHTRLPKLRATYVCRNELDRQQLIFAAAFSLG